MNDFESDRVVECLSVSLMTSRGDLIVEIDNTLKYPINFVLEEFGGALVNTDVVAWPARSDHVAVTHAGFYFAASGARIAVVRFPAPLSWMPGDSLRMGRRGLVLPSPDLHVKHERRATDAPQPVACRRFP